MPRTVDRIKKIRGARKGKVIRLELVQRGAPPVPFRTVAVGGTKAWRQAAEAEGRQKIETHACARIAEIDALLAAARAAAAAKEDA